MQGGFNWWRVAASDRARALPCLRPAPGGNAVPQIDARVSATGLIGPGEVPMAAPQPGAAPWLWSPQGGLRTSLAGCLALARQIGTMDRSPLWSPDKGPADGSGSVYGTWGFGLQILDDPPHWPRPLVGHFADAYGLRGGIWHDAATGDAFAYLLNGVAEVTGPGADAFSRAETDLFAAAAEEIRPA